MPRHGASSTRGRRRGAATRIPLARRAMAGIRPRARRFALAWTVAAGGRRGGPDSRGQSGDPDSPHYRDLFAMWADDRYFPVPYGRARVEAAAEKRWVLAPR